MKIDSLVPSLITEARQKLEPGVNLWHWFRKALRGEFARRVLKARSVRRGLEKVASAAFVLGLYGQLQRSYSRLSLFFPGEEVHPLNNLRGFSILLSQPTRRIHRSPDTNAEQDRITVYSAAIGAISQTWPVSQSGFEGQLVTFGSPSLESWGSWDVREPPYVSDCPRRTARWVKTHPTFLFPGSKYGVWIDSNIIPQPQLHDRFVDFRQSGLDIGLIPHPMRGGVIEEAIECVLRKKDSKPNVMETISRISAWEGLWETNIMFLNLQSDRVATLLAAWWSLIESGSFRDQLSLPTALEISRARVFKIVESGSARSTDIAMLAKHGNRIATVANRRLKRAWLQ